MTAEQRLFLVQQVLMQLSGTRAVSDREITAGGKKGREWVGEGVNGARGVLRIWTGDKRLYAVMAACTREQDAPAVTAFVEAVAFDPALAFNPGRRLRQPRRALEPRQCRLAPSRRAVG